ncbi:MAG TPA: transferrin receptor-like dimerization domain-containing protein [Thermoanaerobaculia bacterium]|nr:transferrin receptor-like dimerization domain-containing protein [Thermoanaerobaculia bacterium]
MIRRALASAIVLLTASTFAQQTKDRPILGFTAANAAKEHALEAQFDAKMNRDNLRAWMQRLSARPHHLGSDYDRQNAEFIASLFRSWGYDTKIEEFQVLFPTPRKRMLELVAPEKFTAKLFEPPLPQDSTSGQTNEQLPVYNAYSIDGDVTAGVAYVNYGVPADYEELERRGVDVKGKIVIARYGGSWRGIKPKVAAEHGAVGCIIYSDPRDDGYFQGDVYPKGAYRSENGAQRGSVMDMPIHPGDPLTPGVGATANAKRIDRKDVEVFTKIPVLPISYSDALPILRALGGAVAPPDWRGALPITYHLGPGPAQVHMQLEFDWKMVPARDIIARLPGTDRADQWIMRGNHHDGWVNGASDPISGQVAMLEEARAIGELAKGGWRPRRTIIYCAWDGEEEGLLGSTEWAEEHGDELRQHGVVYINSDTNTRGFLDAGGSHTLERLTTQVARDVNDPQRKVSVLERLRAREQTLATSPELQKEARERQLIRLDALGSGSDYTPFLQHTGIAAMNIGYGGEGGGGSYHSIYDSFDHYTRFGDPGFQYGIAQAETAGRLVLRLANADVLPIEFTTFADTLSRYLDELTKLAQTTRDDIEERNRLIRERAFEIAADPTKTYVPPKPQPPAPYLNFAPLQNAVAKLQQSAHDYDRAAASLPSDAPNASVRDAALDQALMHIEQALTRPEGLPRRPWFRHQIYAPGFYTGYGVKTVPGVREAIEQKQWSEANQQIEIVARVIENYAAHVDRAADIARGRAE